MPFLEPDQHFKKLLNLSNYRIYEDGVVQSAHNGSLLKPRLNDEGYPKVKLVCDDGVRRDFFVHRLVALAFLPTPSFDQTLVRHKDDNRRNCRADNLEWGTHADNHADKKSRGRLKISTRKLSAKDVKNIRRSSSGAKTIAARFGISISHAREVKNGRKWSTKKKGGRQKTVASET